MKINPDCIREVLLWLEENQKMECSNGLLLELEESQGMEYSKALLTGRVETFTSNYIAKSIDTHSEEDVLYSIKQYGRK